MFHGGLNIGLTERFDRRDIREDHKAVKTLQCQDDRQQHGGHTQTTVRFFSPFSGVSAPARKDPVHIADRGDRSRCV